jgi:hypothetical protein
MAGVWRDESGARSSAVFCSVPFMGGESRARMAVECAGHHRGGSRRRRRGWVPEPPGLHEAGSLLEELGGLAEERPPHCARRQAPAAAVPHLVPPQQQAARHRRRRGEDSQQQQQRHVSCSSLSPVCLRRGRRRRAAMVVVGTRQSKERGRLFACCCSGSRAAPLYRRGQPARARSQRRGREGRNYCHLPLSIFILLTCFKKKKRKLLFICVFTTPSPSLLNCKLQAADRGGRVHIPRRARLGLDRGVATRVRALNGHRHLLRELCLCARV